MIATKPCAGCGRTITWRRKWERDWDSVRYCSDACRRRARSAASRDVDADLDAALVRLLDARGASASVCPSEVARAVAGERGDEDEAWRALMEPARAAARRLVAAGGRVLSVTAVADDLAAARSAAYRGVEAVTLRGGHWRTDIAARAVAGEIAVP